MSMCIKVDQSGKTYIQTRQMPGYIDVHDCYTFACGPFDIVLAAISLSAPSVTLV